MLFRKTTCLIFCLGYFSSLLAQCDENKTISNKDYSGVENIIASQSVTLNNCNFNPLSTTIIVAPVINLNLTSTVHNTATIELINRDGCTCQSEQKVVPEDIADYDYYGGSVSISGTQAVIGTSNRKAYVYKKEGPCWVYEATLVPNTSYLGDDFGRAVSIDGNYIVIGAPNDNVLGNGSGSAFIYYKNGDTWNQTNKITAPNGSPRDAFGSSVSILNEIIVISSPEDDDNISNSGSIFVYSKNQSGWIQSGKINSDSPTLGEKMGISVSIYDNQIVAGAQGNEGKGNAYVFSKTGSNWNQTAELIIEDGNSGDSFGRSVSIENDQIIVGASGVDEGRGRAYIFEKIGITWTLVDQLMPDDLGRLDHFGESVSISGDKVAIGAIWYSGQVGQDSQNGATFIYEKGATEWSQIFKYIAQDHMAGGGRDFQGSSVSISGDEVITGAPYKSDMGNRNGSAYIFKL